MKVDVAQAYDDNDAFNNKWFISDYSRPEVGSGWWVASPFFDTREEAEVWARAHYGKDVEIEGPEDWPEPNWDASEPKFTVIEGGKP